MHQNRPRTTIRGVKIFDIHSVRDQPGQKTTYPVIQGIADVNAMPHDDKTITKIANKQHSTMLPFEERSVENFG